MIIKGKATSAEIFTETIERTALEWVSELCNNVAMEGVPIFQMPDVHAGNNCNVGTAYPVGAYVNPDHVGVDIGCTISMHRLSACVNPEDFALLDHRIREAIPMGTEICAKNAINEKELFRFLNSQYQRARSVAPDLINEVPRIDAIFISDFCRRIKLQEGVFYKSLGTLGGGNHFIELDQSDDGSLYLVVHTGSRHLGEEVAEYYTKLANSCLKEQGKEVPYYMSYLEGDNKTAYMEDVQIIQRYAEWNREIIVREILKGMKWKAAEQFSVPHNYLDDSGILRKGAISAKKGERVVIPVNMRDGIILGIGKGNADWNYSAPHGSGRKLKRDDVKNKYTVSEFKKEMKGIYSSCVSADTLDEAPFAYRSITEIVGQIRDTVEVTEILKPVYNFKAGSRK